MQLFYPWLASRLFVTPWAIAHPDSSVLGISQAEYPGVVAIFFSEVLTPGVSSSSTMAGRFFTAELSGSPFIPVIEGKRKLSFGDLTASVQLPLSLPSSVYMSQLTFLGIGN